VSRFESSPTGRLTHRHFDEIAQRGWHDVQKDKDLGRNSLINLEDYLCKYSVLLAVISRELLVSELIHPDIVRD
jgi:hypothetical protein